MQIQPYLFLDGRAEEAAEFYTKALGAKVETMLRFKDGPVPEGGEGCAGATLPPGSENKVMHLALRIGETLVMASDGSCLGQPEFKGFSLTIEGANDEETKRLFDALGDGGQVQQPLTPTFFTSSFGMVADRFGVSWMVLTSAPAA
jgi:PhnB protein